MAISAENNAIRFEDLFKVITRHSRKALGTWLLLMLVTLLAIYFLPRKYKSEALLFVRVGRESVSLDPSATTGQTMSLNQSRESELNSILEVISSRSLMERVVDQLGPESILRPPSIEGEESGSLLGGVVSAVGQLASVLEPSGAISLREKAVQALLGGARIGNARKSNIISIYYTSKTPAHAQTITRAISDEYIQEHRRIHRTDGSYEFFVDQSAMFQAQLETALDTYRDAKNQMRLSSIEGKRSLVESHVLKLETEKLSAVTALTASMAKLASIEATVAKLPERVKAQDVQGMPNVAGDSMRQALFGLEIKQKNLLSKYTADHPELQRVSEAVEGAKDIVETQATSRVHSTMIMNPTLQKFREAYMNESANAASLQAKHDVLDRQLQVAIKNLEEVNGQEKRLKALERDIDMAERNYYSCAEKLEQARIQQSLDEEHISNIMVTQPASLVEKPVSPNKALVLMAGCVAACMGGLLVAIYEDRKAAKIKNRQEVQDVLGTTLLAERPEQGTRESYVH